MKYTHFAGPRKGGLDVDYDYTPYYPIRERDKAIRGEVISQRDAIQLLTFADLKSKRRFKGANEGIPIR